MEFPNDYGCEVYEGDAKTIGAAVSIGNWQALRNGTAAHSFVGFPQFISGHYFDFLGTAVASILGKTDAEVRVGDFPLLAGEDGHWGAGILGIEWVAAAAAIPAAKITALGREWRENYHRQKYVEEEDWPEAELLDPLYRLTLLCAEATRRRSDVVLLVL